LRTTGPRTSEHQRDSKADPAAQGIVATEKNIWAASPPAGITAAKADYIATYGSDPTSTHSIRSIFFVKTWTGLSTTSRWTATDGTGVAGQGNSDPLAVFHDHALVEYGSKFYDPSYGTGPFSTILAWEVASVNGVGVHFSLKPDHLKSNFKYWTRVLDATGTQEILENDPINP
jgi:hypothetical protein